MVNIYIYMVIIWLMMGNYKLVSHFLIEKPKVYPMTSHPIPMTSQCSIVKKHIKTRLVGDAITILKNMSSSMGRMIPYMKWTIKTC